MQRISWGGVCIPWRWNELTFRLFFLQNDSGVFWIHKGGKEVRTRSVYHDQERKNPADRWRVSWISMKNWELLFIWKGCPVMPEPLQKPVRLQMAEDICGIIRKMNKGVLPGWISILWSMNKVRYQGQKVFCLWYHKYRRSIRNGKSSFQNSSFPYSYFANRKELFQIHTNSNVNKLWKVDFVTHSP